MTATLCEPIYGPYWATRNVVRSCDAAAQLAALPAALRGCWPQGLTQGKAHCCSHHLCGRQRVQPCVLSRQCTGRDCSGGSQDGEPLKASPGQQRKADHASPAPLVLHVPSGVRSTVSLDACVAGQGRAGQGRAAGRGRETVKGEQSDATCHAALAAGEFDTRSQGGSLFDVCGCQRCFHQLASLPLALHRHPQQLPPSHCTPRVAPHVSETAAARPHTALFAFHPLYLHHCHWPLHPLTLHSSHLHGRNQCRCTLHLSHSTPRTCAAVPDYCTPSLCTWCVPPSCP